MPEGGRTTTTDDGIMASIVEHWLTMGPGGGSCSRPLPNPEDGRIQPRAVAFAQMIALTAWYVGVPQSDPRCPASPSNAGRMS
jgi:hypothetical protein